jgi:hypothetical protein
MTRVLAAAAVSGTLLFACTVPSFEAPIGSPDRPKDSGNTTGGEECTESGGATTKPTPEDPNKFPKCACAKGGTARCIAKDKVPASSAKSLSTCDEGGPGYCVPDSLVKSGGAAPPTCKSIAGEGRCMSLCVPRVADKAAVLNRGEGNICGEDERCVPCLDPLDGNKPTGVCDIGKPVQSTTSCTNKGGTPGDGTTPGGGTPSQPLSCPYTGPPVVDVTSFDSCGDGARCVVDTLIPEGARAMLKKCSTAKAPSGLCAPEKSIAAGGQYLPKTCKSIASAEGRCLNVNIPAVESQKASLPQDLCDANERCTPCYSPIDGKETGACKSVTCDSPKQAAVLFKGCCEKDNTLKGKCVPKSMIPAAQQEKLDDDDCVKDQELCAPNENLDPTYKAPACTASTFFTGNYSGVCVSDCINFSFIENLGTSRGSCAKNYTCVPCERNGKPTGAPGCPNTPNLVE